MKGKIQGYVECVRWSKSHTLSGVTGKHVPPRNIIPMGIDSLRNHSEFTPRYIFACMRVCTHGYRFAMKSYPWVHTLESINSLLHREQLVPHRTFWNSPIGGRHYSAT